MVCTSSAPFIPDPITSSMRKPLAGHLEKKSYIGRYLLLRAAVAYAEGGNVAATRDISCKGGPKGMLTPCFLKGSVQGPRTFIEGHIQDKTLFICPHLPTVF